MSPPGSCMQPDGFSKVPKMSPPGSHMEPGGSVQDAEMIIFATVRPKVAKMSPPGSYMGPDGSV
eukprot:9685462-Karenia_brevis.AAC.1